MVKIELKDGIKGNIYFRLITEILRRL